MTTTYQPIQVIKTRTRICGWCVAMWSVVLAIDAIGGYAVYWMFT